MKLFVSYARVDKPYCVKIVNTLDVHEVWYDQRLYAGQQWWKEILRRIDWCEGFVYLLSSDSVVSEYCLRELDIAIQHGRQIIPVMIQKDTPLPKPLASTQYVDLSGGLDANTVQLLLNSIYIAEQYQNQQETIPITTSDFHQMDNTVDANSTRIVSLAAEAMQNDRFDQAIFLLRQAKLNGYKSRFIDISVLLSEAEIALERQSYRKEAEREYSQILDLISYPVTRHHACAAFRSFQEIFPDYDPENLAEMCVEMKSRMSEGVAKKEQTRGGGGKPGQRREEQKRANGGGHHNTGRGLPLLDFVEIPDGRVQLDNANGSSRVIPAFRISRYPVTNEQFQAFIDDPRGYRQPRWWHFSEEAAMWRSQNTAPQKPGFKGDERPREMVTWFEAVAYIRWLSHRLGMSLSLPYIHHWQRALQGNDDRIFPWGNELDPTRCNTRESRLKMTTPVNRFPEGQSFFGVYDLAGNTWEWTLNERLARKDDGSDERIMTYGVVGGAFVSPLERAQVGFNYYLEPRTLYTSIGFRIVHSS